MPKGKGGGTAACCKRLVPQRWPMRMRREQSCFSQFPSASILYRMGIYTNTYLRRARFNYEANRPPASRRLARRYGRYAPCRGGAERVPLARVPARQAAKRGKWQRCSTTVVSSKEKLFPVPTPRSRQKNWPLRTIQGRSGDVFRRTNRAAIESDVFCRASLPPGGAPRSCVGWSFQVSAIKTWRIRSRSPLKSLNKRFKLTAAPVHWTCRWTLSVPM